jgi:hypothetical protein
MVQTQIDYCKNRYRKVKGFDLDLDNPRYFTEKIQWKKFYDHNPLYTVTSNKLAIYDYLKDITDLTPPKLLSVDTPPDTERWIAKANHGSGWNMTYDTYNHTKAMGWLKERYAPYAGEWAYEDIQPHIIYQEYIESIVDIKFFVFNGKIGCVQHVGYNPYTSNIYTPDWKPIDVFWVFPQGKVIDKPPHYDRIVKYAEQLGVFDFARIDFMVTEDALYLSEITHYPTSGFQVIKPMGFDLELGKLWTTKLE